MHLHSVLTDSCIWGKRQRVRRKKSFARQLSKKYAIHYTPLFRENWLLAATVLGSADSLALVVVGTAQWLTGGIIVSSVVGE